MEVGLRIVITGTHSTGKTTTVDALAEYLRLRSTLQVTSVSEIARQLASEGIDISRNVSTDLYFEIFARHMYNESAASDGHVIFDRFIPDYMAYAALSGICSSAFIAAMEMTHRLLMRVRPYDYVFLCDTDVPLIPDGVRDEDTHFRMEVDTCLRAILTRLNQSFVVVTGSPEMRLNQILAATALDASIYK